MSIGEIGFMGVSVGVGIAIGNRVVTNLVDDSYATAAPRFKAYILESISAAYTTVQKRYARWNSGTDKHDILRTIREDPDIGGEKADLDELRETIQEVRRRIQSPPDSLDDPFNR